MYYDVVFVHILLLYFWYRVKWNKMGFPNGKVGFHQWRTRKIIQGIVSFANGYWVSRAFEPGKSVESKGLCGHLAWIAALFPDRDRVQRIWTIFVKDLLKSASRRVSLVQQTLNRIKCRFSPCRSPEKRKTAFFRIYTQEGRKRSVFRFRPYKYVFTCISLPASFYGACDGDYGPHWE